MKFRDNKQLIEHINGLDGYQGYVQFSNRVIEDIWTVPSKVSIDDKDGFIYEAHFCNDKESLSIKQINNEWILSKTDISKVNEEDIQIYFAQEKNVKMAQVWVEEADELCEGMMVQKLKKTVFAGFVGGDK